MQNTTQHKRDEIIIKNLKPSTKYSFRVVAVDSTHGLGESSDAIVVKTNDDIANNVLGPPLNVKASPVSVKAIEVSWEPPINLPPKTRVQYEVYYQEINTSSFAHEEQKISSWSTSTTIDNLDTFTEYTIWVNAVTQNGTGVASSEIVAKTFSDSEYTFVHGMLWEERSKKLKCEFLSFHWILPIRKYSDSTQ